MLSKPIFYFFEKPCKELWDFQSSNKVAILSALLQEKKQLYRQNRIFFFVIPGAHTSSYKNLTPPEFSG